MKLFTYSLLTFLTVLVFLNGLFGFSTNVSVTVD